MHRGRALIAGVLVLVLAFGIGGAQPEGGDWAGPGISLADARDWLRESLGLAPSDVPAVDEPLPASAERALPRHEVAPVGARLPEPERVAELTDLHTETATFYRLSDGRVEAELAAAPERYRDGGGELRPIDTTLVAGDPDGPAYVNHTNTFGSGFSTDPAQLASFTLDGHEITIGVPGVGGPATPAADGDTVTYPDLLGAGADLRYRVTSTALKEEIVLHRPPASGTFSFSLDLAGLTARELPDGSIGFYDTDQDIDPLLVMPAPFMFDSAEDPESPYGTAWSPRVSQTLRHDGDQLRVEVSADRQWLADPRREYPVVIDPTVAIRPTPTQAQDAMIVSDDPGANFDGNWRLSVGTTSLGKARSMVRFDLSAVPAGVSLDTAALKMYFDQNHTTGEVDAPLEARRVTEPWDAGTVTWNSAAGDIGQRGASVEMVDDSDTGKVAASGEWPASGSPLTAHAIHQSYHFNNNSTGGETFTWVPDLPEDGEYQVQAHYVPAFDRATAAPYTIHHASGQTTVEVDQTAGAEGEWADLGSYEFTAGTAHRVVLGDVPGRAVIADAVRFIKHGTVIMAAGQSSQWHSYDVRNITQDWLDGVHPNHGFALKAVDELHLGQGGPRYEAAEFAYNGESRHTPTLVLRWAEPSVELAAPERIHATGAELDWTGYEGEGLVEYQVHRSVFQTFTPSAATLVAPVPPQTTEFTDTTATPTPVDDPDPFGQVYYYMVAVKTAGGKLIPGPTQIARLPRAGRVVQVFRGAGADTTLTAGQPDANQDVLADKPWLMAGNNSLTFGTSRAAVGFPDLTDAIPAGARVLDADLDLWSVTTIGSGADYRVHALTEGFDETSATWNQSASGQSWNSPGGDHDASPADTLGNLTNDPAWRTWEVDDLVQGWLDDPASNHGFLVKLADESGPAERTLFLSSEAAEPLLHPKLVVTYTEPTPVHTYHAPQTPAIRLIPGDDYTIPVTVSNPTGDTFSALLWELSYRWELPDGTDVTTGGNQLATPLPSDVPPGGAVDVPAALRTPIQSDEGNKRTSFVLRWELRNRVTGEWLSSAHGIGSLDQNVVVEDPTSDELGMEHFYQYTAAAAGAGASLYANTHTGNSLLEYQPFANPGRGVATFTRMVYNSQDTSASSMGYGWSLSGSTISRLGSPLAFHPPGQEWPTQVTLTDGDGTSHYFTLSKHGSANPADWEYDHPAGVHLHLQQVAGGDPSRAWVMTRPDRTQFFFDEDGYPSAVVDRNGNTQTFTYEERRSANQPTKFLKYVTDPAGRQSLTLEYYQKGRAYEYIDDNGDRVVDNNLTNPHIIDQVRSITDISGRQVTLTYTDKGLMAELVDGAGTAEAKTFALRYDALQGNKNVKLVGVTDPRGNTTELAYYEAPVDPKDKWRLQTITDRRSGQTDYDYVDPDGQAGSFMETTVTDAEGNDTLYRTDGFGRPVEIADALARVDTLTWDADNNVVEHEAANGAVTSWTYDPKTGYPLTRTDAEANAHGGGSTVLTYQTGLDGHIADLVAKTSPAGRRWEFGYDAVGNLTSVTDPLGTTTPDPDDFTTTYTYDPLGQLLTATDPNGNTTSYDDYHPVGFPELTTDALGNDTRTEYDARGNVTAVTDARSATSTASYDVFGRPLETVVPKDQAAGEFITTPSPVYDANDNVLVEPAPNGAVTEIAYDPADRPLTVSLPRDTPEGPERLLTMTYDAVGNLLTQTEPNGSLTPQDPHDFVTEYLYDEVYQLVALFDADGGHFTQEYDEVGNVVEVVDARKNATADPDDYTARTAYDLNHRVVEETDAAGHSVSYQFDADGNVIATTDQEGVTTELARDERELVTEIKVPHRTESGTTTFRVTRFEYDEAGNQIATITPRGVATPNPDDFTQRTVYDPLNRPVVQEQAYDPADDRYHTPAETRYEYDEVGNLVRVSAPPSEGQSVRNDTAYTHFDNGWVRSSSDPWDIATSYDYNLLGQQTEATVSSAGGSQSRTIGWSYFPDGKLRSRTDSGVPVGAHVVLVDNSDVQHTEATGDWDTGADGDEFHGFDYRTHAAAGASTDMFRWRLTIPADGDYEVSVRYAEATATDAEYTVAHADGEHTVGVDQTTQAGEWVGIGSYRFEEGVDHDITLEPSAGGTVVADAVKLVRDNSGEADNEHKEIEYRYDANGNLVRLTDASPDAVADEWVMAYDVLNRVTRVEERAGGSVEHLTELTYDPNGNPLTRSHDDQLAELTYDVRDAVSSVRHTLPDVSAKESTFTYTPKGRVDRETAANGNAVEYEYFLDGLIRSQVERRADGTVVNEHTLTYTANSHIATDQVRTQDADAHAEYLERTYTYEYDPRDRLIGATRTGVGGGDEQSQTYLLDDNGNTVSQTIDGDTTDYLYDRNRLLSATAVGGLTSQYNYDPYGRLDTVVQASAVIEKYTYDGFDRTASHRAGSGAQASTTEYVYDPFNRTVSRTSDAGGTDEKVTEFSYLGVEAQVATETVDGDLSRTYQYGGQGERLSMLAHDQGATPEFSVYGYDTRGNVDLITDLAGNARATYGYLAYGSPDTELMTGVDAPDPAEPDKDAYNTFRFQAKQLDPVTGNYDMGSRDYDPGLNRFLSRDMYAGALADLGLAVDAFTLNRYAFAGANPLSLIEFGGHFGWSDFGHAVLDVVGLVPVVGEAADLANAAWYAAEGDHANAALSAASAVPFVGWGASAVKAGKYVYKGVDAARSGSRYADEIADVGAAARRADTPRATDPDTPTGARGGDSGTSGGGGSSGGGSGPPAGSPPPAAKPAPAPATKPASNGPSCPIGNSFTPDTEVVMADGTTTPIADIQVGDQVLAADPTTGREAARPVTALIVGEGAKHLVTITITTDTGQGGSVVATDGHPFWETTTSTWTDAEDLTPGHRLHTAAGDTVTVDAISHTVQTQRVHNLTIADLHTYHVMAGNTPVLVHNTNPCGISMDDALDRAAKHVGDNPAIVRSGSGGVQFMSATVDSAGNTVRRIARFDVNPNSAHVQQWGPHLNLETQINGRTVTSGPLKDPHIPIMPSTIRRGDWWD